MIRYFFLLAFVLLQNSLWPQGSYCNMNGNLMIFSNYDGGALNINIDVNIPNLKIGIVSYESCVVTLSGTYVNNVTGVVYAGYSGTNNHCSSGTTTSINGAPTSATKAILQYPAVTLTNSNGYPFIICAYSCSINTSQGGCNTIDQVEAFMLNYFPGSLLYAHRVQYGCWLGSQSVSAGGNCCASISSLTLTSKVTNASCLSQCNGSVSAGAAGGNPPYTYTLNGTSNFTNLCPGNYIVRVVDGLSNFRVDTVTVVSSGTVAPSGDSIQAFCHPSTIASLAATGGIITWYDSDTSQIALNGGDALTDGMVYYATSTISGCESESRLKVKVKLYAGNLTIVANNTVLTALADSVSYQWIDCTNKLPIANATTKSFVPAASGFYAVVITEHGCSDTSLCIQVNIVGISDSGEGKETFTFFPNPANDQIVVRFAKRGTGHEIEILSPSSAICLRFPIPADALEIQLPLDLPGGLYLIRIRSEDGESSAQKMILD